jgi:AcrR family transcriptional regulator
MRSGGSHGGNFQYHDLYFDPAIRIFRKMASRPASSTTTSRRMPREERRKVILDHAIAYFAEVGFSADTRALAERVGVSQAILYRHFESKDALIAAVFERLTTQQDVGRWEEIISNRSTPLFDRLLLFFEQYSASTYTFQWIRIHMHASLQGGDFNRQYIQKVTEPLLRLIAREIRRELGFSSNLIGRVSDMEIELLWLFHYGLYYHPFRQHVYGLTLTVSFGDIIRHGLVGALASVEQYLRSRYPDIALSPERLVGLLPVSAGTDVHANATVCSAPNNQTAPGPGSELSRQRAPRQKRTR